MIVPLTVEDLSRQLAEVQTPIAGVDLRHLRSIVEHTPEDMTATVESGLTLAEFQAELKKHGQWIPLDPPHPERLTIADLLAHDLSGPRRRGYGAAREYVIGMRVVLGGGEIIRNGGKVVKNVAGYDLCRLFIGARHSLGIIVEATFKLRPLPEIETVLQARCHSLSEAGELARRVEESRMEPVIFDLQSVSGGLTLVLGFAGAREDVAQQTERARAAGFHEPALLDYNIPLKQKASLLPSETLSWLKQLSGSRFIARLGNGIVYHDNATLTVASAGAPKQLMSRAKDAYDPKHILPDHFS